jgi:hypothetical protein
MPYNQNIFVGGFHPQHFYARDSERLAEREMRDYYEELAVQAGEEEAWRECVLLMPANPVKMYKLLYHTEVLPMSAIIDGYSSSDDPFISSYGTFERECLSDIQNQNRDIEREIALGRVFLKNNIFLDETNSRIAAVNHVEINKSDGYVENSIVSGKISDKSPREYSSWFTDEKVAEVGKPTLIKAQMYANKAYNISLPKEKIGTDQFFFEDRNDFTEAWTDHPVGTADAIMVNDAMNPEFISFKTKLMGVQAFDNVLAYTQATGMPTFADMSTFLLQVNYFAHDVLNVLLPKQIVLVMDTYRGLIDVPKKDYIPNIREPLINIPDYDNKMWHVIAMMKKIAQQGFFKRYVGNMYLKLTITPALLVINFISEYAPQMRLIIGVPLIDNQILYDAESRNEIFPGQFIWGARLQPGTGNRRFHTGNQEALESLGNVYHDRLIGLGPTEANDYASPYVSHGVPTIFDSNSNAPLFGWYE